MFCFIYGDWLIVVMEKNQIFWCLEWFIGVSLFIGCEPLACDVYLFACVICYVNCGTAFCFNWYWVVWFFDGVVGDWGSEKESYVDGMGMLLQKYFSYSLGNTRIELVNLVISWNDKF